MRDRLREASNPVTRTKLSKLLEAAQKGLASNETVTSEDLLVFVNGVLETHLPIELEAIRAASAEAEAALGSHTGELA